MPSIRSRVIDAKLRAMLRKAEPGETYSLRQLADGTCISHQAVHQIEQRALRKLRNLGAGAVSNTNLTMPTIYSE